MGVLLYITTKWRCSRIKGFTGLCSENEVMFHKSKTSGINNNFTVIIKLWYENDVILTDLHDFSNKTDEIPESSLHLPNELVFEYNICISELV